MPRRYVFLVHGVGKQEVGKWHLPWVEALTTALAQYAPYKGMSAETIQKDHLRFIPVSYDSIFEGYRQRWGDESKALLDVEVIPEGDLSSALQWVRDNGDGSAIETAFWDSVLDAILWFALPLARAPVIAHVAQQIVAGLQDMLAENGSLDGAHCVAHSLGSSVLHDAVVSLTYGHDIHQGVFNPAQFKWESVSMVANTSELLAAWKDLSRQTGLQAYQPYTSVVRPGAAPSSVNNYFNFRHQLDPIAWAHAFEPKGWPAASFHELVLKRFANPLDVHAVLHYLANPAVTLQMLRAFMATAALGSQAEFAALNAAYEKQYPLTEAAVLGDAQSDDTLDLTKYLTGLVSKGLKL